MKRYAFLLALLLTIVTMSVAANVAKQQSSAKCTPPSPSEQKS